jgi:hypothetical protein
LIVKISEYVEKRSGRVPITLTKYVPFDFNEETNIAPVFESTLIRSVAELSECPSELSKPAYVQVVA